MDCAKRSILGTDRLIELKLAGIADLDDDATFDGVTLVVEAHLAGDAIEVFDVGQEIGRASCRERV